MSLPTRRVKAALALTLAAVLIMTSCAVSDNTNDEPSTPSARSSTQTEPATTAAPVKDTSDIAAPATPPQPAPTTTEATEATDCHPAYVTCIPNLAGDALNCSDLSSSQKPVRVKQTGIDPYRLDGDRDGVGCESSTSSSQTQRQTDRTTGRTCTHNGRGHGYLGYNPGTHTHPTNHTHKTGKCAGV
ncbi:excalibur calcium-binding domain-containing protein [Candidatus Poriferisodalis sp.]|uniref:excalibur calcium-binding domain-containing protein n=1 Tax=Candidatus Poriferisodalis sp. TaxID=3101277 RepID=UPI003B51684C